MNQDHCDFLFSAEEMRYLGGLLAGMEDLATLLRDRSSPVGSKTSVRLGSAEAARLGDLLTVHLAQLGFEEDYSLTEEGRMLEDLIDILFWS